MRKVGLRAVCLFSVLMVLAGTALADDLTLNLESRIVQNFDASEDQQWFVMGSKFASTGFPKITFVKSVWPNALYGNEPTDKDKLSVMGVALMFDRKEYNWVDIVPGSMTKASDGKTTLNPKEIPLPGRVATMDVWIWGSGFNYYMEVYLRDYRGIVHPVNMGMINHRGWKDIRFNIPSNIPQTKSTAPNLERLNIVKFRVWTTPTEVVAVYGEDQDPQKLQTSEDKKNEQPISRAIFIYLDQIKVLTDTYETLFDGDALAAYPNVKKNWENAGSSSIGK
jgi:hypothetical protein